MLLTAFFSDKGVPKTGLTPTIDVWEDDATHVVNAQNMTEIAGGWYKYNFAGYDESKDYVIRADGGASLADNDRYCFSSNEVGQVTEDLTDIKGTGFVKDTDSLVDIRPETDKIQTGIIDVPNTYKANVATLALEASVQLVKTETDKIQPDIIAVPGNYKADVSNLDVAVSSRSSHAAADIWTVAVRTLTSYGTLIADVWAAATRTLTAGTRDTEIDAIKVETDKIPAILTDTNEIQTKLPNNNIMGSSVKTDKDDEIDDIKTEVDKIQPDIIDVPNTYKADVTNLDVAISSRSSHSAADIWAVGVRTLTSFGTLVADIWAYATRTLTSFGTLIADVWTVAIRTLTAGTKDAEIDAIKLETDKIQPDIIGSPNDYKADVSALALEASVQSVKAETDKIQHILGLVQENFRLKDQAYNAAGNLTSATIRIYPTAADCDADVNEIAEYTMTATYDASGNCTSYKVTKV